MSQTHRSHLEQLAEQVRAVEATGSVGGSATDRVATGWPAVDAVLGGGLLAGAVHEWVSEGPEEPAGGSLNRDAPPPLRVLMHLMRQAMGVEGGWGVWIGRACFAYPHGLVGEQPVLQRLLWADPPDGAGRLWAIDLAARCEGMTAIIADGSGLDMAATRRLQLAAEAGGTLLLLARPQAERKALSAATTRWGVRPVVSETDWPRWEIELLRCKGSQRGAGTEGQDTWLLEGRHQRGQGLVVIPAEPAARSVDAQVASPAARQQYA